MTERTRYLEITETETNQTPVLHFRQNTLSNVET